MAHIRRYGVSTRVMPADSGDNISAKNPHAEEHGTNT
jgi:hypothetical protein